MKISLQHRSTTWHPFLHFTLLSNSISLTTKKKLLFQKQGLKKWSFVHLYLEESVIKNLYKKLHGLYRVSACAFEAQKKQGKVQANLSPLEEQAWFIQFLRDKVSFFSSKEIWTVLLNIEQRDKYVRYLEISEDWTAFEIFIQNYWAHALTGKQLVDVFNLAFSDRQESISLLELLFCYLGCEQAFELMLALKTLKFHPNDWEEYCRSTIQVMRNSQIKKIISLLPSSLMEHALKKLYPCEILDIIEDEKNDIRKSYFIEIALEHHKEWWSDFCYQEVKETANLLENLKQE